MTKSELENLVNELVAGGTAKTNEAPQKSFILEQTQNELRRLESMGKNGYDQHYSSLTSLSAVFNKNSSEKGFWDNTNPRNPDVALSKLMLIVSELAEACEEVRKGNLNVPESNGVYLSENGKPEGVAVELADALIRILDFSAAMGYDIGEVVNRSTYITQAVHTSTESLYKTKMPTKYKVVTKYKKTNSGWEAIGHFTDNNDRRVSRSFIVSECETKYQAKQELVVAMENYDPFASALNEFSRPHFSEKYNR